VTDRYIYVQGGQGGSVALAFDHDRKLAWQSQAQGVGGYASPALINSDGVDQLVVFAGKAIYGMDPLTGFTIWEVPWDTKFAVNASTPVYRDGHLFVTSEYGKGGIMLKVTGTGVSTLWTDKDIQSKFQPAILDGNTLFVNSAGTIKCLKWPTRELYWTAKDSKLRLGVGGSILRVADKLIVLHEKGILSLAKANENGIELISQFTPTRGGQVWATPLLYGGRLYVKGETELFCFDVSNPPQ
jgi:outer membrane protein assembly factor BamB